MTVDGFDGVGCCSRVNEDDNGGKCRDLGTAREFESRIPRLAEEYGRELRDKSRERVTICCLALSWWKRGEERVDLRCPQLSPLLFPS